MKMEFAKKKKIDKIEEKGRPTTKKKETKFVQEHHKCCACFKLHVMGKFTSGFPLFIENIAS